SSGKTLTVIPANAGIRGNAHRLPRSPPAGDDGSWLLIILAQFQPTDLVAMYLVGSIGETQRPRMSIGAGEAEIVRHAAGAVNLNRPVDDLAQHVRRRDLDHRDLGARALVADRVHEIGRLQRQQPALLDGDARLRDALQRHRLFRDRLAERDARLGALAHFLERVFRLADGAHAVMDASGAEPPLRDLEAAAFAQKDVRRRHADIDEIDLGMA